MVVFWCHEKQLTSKTYVPYRSINRFCFPNSDRCRNAWRGYVFENFDIRTSWIWINKSTNQSQVELINRAYYHGNVLGEIEHSVFFRISSILFTLKNFCPSCCVSFFFRRFVFDAITFDFFQSRVWMALKILNDIDTPPISRRRHEDQRDHTSTFSLVDLFARSLHSPSTPSPTDLGEGAVPVTGKRRLTHLGREHSSNRPKIWWPITLST